MRRKKSVGIRHVLYLHFFLNVLSGIPTIYTSVSLIGIVVVRSFTVIKFF